MRSFFEKCLLWRERVQEGQVQRERGTEDPKQALHWQQRTNVGLEPTNCEIMTWAEFGGITHGANSAETSVIRKLRIENISCNFYCTGAPGWLSRLSFRLQLRSCMMSRSVSSSPESGFVLSVQSLELASDSVSLSLCPSPSHSLSLSKNE